MPVREQVEVACDPIPIHTGAINIPSQCSLLISSQYAYVSDIRATDLSGR
jgi:hypothetical protein